MERDRCAGAVRMRVAAAVLAAVGGVAACGGGSDGPLAGAPGVLLQVDTRVNGAVVGDPALAGREVAAAIQAGQSIEFDANEPVAWSFSVNGGESFGSGNTVVVNGVSITQTTLDPLRVAIGTAVVGTPVLPINVRLTAISVRDVTQVAVVQLQVR
ncbi:MAG: hypothetical protein ACJ8GO_12865 [Ramlibacter sp.]